MSEQSERVERHECDESGMCCDPGGFVPMPTTCPRWGCDNAPIRKNERGFMACTSCYSSYGYAADPGANLPPIERSDEIDIIFTGRRQR